jgi:hypothetical protein
MITIDTWAELDAACAAAEPNLRPLLAAWPTRFVDFRTFPLDALGVFHIIEPDDTEAAVETVLGFSPLEGWEAANVHPGWLELIWVVSDDGFGHVAYLETWKAGKLDSCAAWQTGILANCLGQSARGDPAQ